MSEIKSLPPLLPAHQHENGAATRPADASVPVSVASPSPLVVYTPDQTAEILNVSTATLRRWRSCRPHRGPAYVRIERQVGYRHEDVQDYLAAHRVASEAA